MARDNFFKIRVDAADRSMLDDVARATGHRNVSDWIRDAARRDLSQSQQPLPPTAPHQPDPLGR